MCTCAFAFQCGMGYVWNDRVHLHMRKRLTARVCSYVRACMCFPVSVRVRTMRACARALHVDCVFRMLTSHTREARAISHIP